MEQNTISCLHLKNCLLLFIIIILCYSTFKATYFRDRKLYQVVCTYIGFLTIINFMIRTEAIFAMIGLPSMKFLYIFEHRSVVNIKSKC